MPGRPLPTRHCASGAGAGEPVLCSKGYTPGGAVLQMDVVPPGRLDGGKGFVLLDPTDGTWEPGDLPPDWRRDD